MKPITWCLFYFAIALARSGRALQCWKCEGAASIVECTKNGSLETCVSDQDSCSTIMRHENGLTMIFKGCKQTKACHNQMNENHQLQAYDVTKCDPTSTLSLCVCCCEEDSCNQGRPDCFAKGINSPSSCEVISSFPHGRVSCSASNQPGSVCTFQCTEESYTIHPPEVNQLTCLKTGKWNTAKPCCALPCPPYVVFDLVTLVHASNNKTFEDINYTGSLGYRDLVVSREEGNMYAKADFSGEVHESGQITFNQTLFGTFVRDNERPPYQNTADGKVNIGKAMTWALNNLVGPGTGDRPRVRDILLIGTDSSSDDDVTAPARAWREKGALIYVMAFPNQDGELPDRNEMMRITEDQEHIFYFRGNRTTAAEVIFADTISHFCTNICDHVLHDHE